MFANQRQRSSQERQGNAEVLDVASAIHECQSSNAKYLWIFDPLKKLTYSGTYEICGTYKDKKPEVWFYLASSVCPGGNYLLNLFFVHRQVGDIVIGVSDSNKMDAPVGGKLTLPNSLQYFSFKSSKPNQNHYLKTYNLPAVGFLFKESQEGCPSFVDVLSIPISISTVPKATTNTDIAKHIKIDHFKDLFNKMGPTDYTLETLSKKQYKVHKLILSLRSPILREIVSSKPTCATLDVHDEDMELLLQVLYGGLNKMLNGNGCKRLLEMARKFQLNNVSSVEEVKGLNQDY